MVLIVNAKTHLLFKSALKLACQGAEKNYSEYTILIVKARVPINDYTLSNSKTDSI